MNKLISVFIKLINVFLSILSITVLFFYLDTEFIHVGEKGISKTDLAQLCILFIIGYLSQIILRISKRFFNINNDDRINN